MSNTQALRRAHPIAIYFNLYRFLYLLLIPLARGIVATLTGGLLEWFSGAWFDLLMIALIVLLAYAKWRCTQYYADIHAIQYTIGIFYRQEIAIPMRQICTIAIEQPLWMRPLRIVRLHVDTFAQNPKRADLSLYLTHEEGQRLLRLHHPTDPPQYAEAVYSPRLLDVVFLSLFTSNSFIGIVFVATFISQIGRLLGDGLYAFLNALVRQISVGMEPLYALMAFAFRLPPIATGIAAVLLGGWVFAFLLTLFQTKNLTAARTEGFLHITGGIFVKNQYSLRLSDLCYIDIRQSLLTRVLQLYSVFLTAVGLGKNRTDIRSLIPFSTRKRCKQQLDALLEEYEESERTIRPNRGAVMKFVLEPLWPCVLVPLVTWIGVQFLPAWSSILWFAGWMVSVPCYWFLGVRVMDFVSSGIGKRDGYYTLRYSKSYYLHTVVFSREKIAMVNIRQSILQRTDLKCDVKISTKAEKPEKHHIRNVPWDETAEIFCAEDGVRLPPSLWDRVVGIFQHK